MTIQEVKVVWQGKPGLPGYSTFYAVPAGFSMPALRTFFDSLKAFIPTGITVQLPSTGNLINEQNGDITGDWTAPPSAVIAGTYNPSYGAPVGAVVNWMTSAFLAGRRLRGRTYLVPMGVIDVTGGLAVATQATIQAAATALVAAQSGAFLVWARPSASGASDGSIGAVTSALVPDKVAILRSRRD